MGRALLLTFGVILPLLTLGIELTSGMCAEELFDPIPTHVHTLAILASALANLWSWSMLRSEAVLITPMLALSSGFSMGISLSYAVVFLPIAPIALLAVFVLGLGLLPLSPALSLFTAILLRRRLNQRGRAAGLPTHGRLIPVGFGLALGVLFLGSMPDSAFPRSPSTPSPSLRGRCTGCGSRAPSRSRDPTPSASSSLRRGRSPCVECCRM